MKKVIVSIALIAAAASAFASCPIGTRYQCFSTPSGKLNCGCY